MTDDLSTATSSVKKTASQILTTLIFLVFVGLFLLIGLKSCTVEYWGGVSQNTTYSIAGGDGRVLEVVFMPDKNALFKYYDSGTTELVLVKLWGTRAEHIFGNFWKLKDQITGFRICEDDVVPVSFRMTVLDKWIDGTDVASFPGVGKAQTTNMYFGDHRINFQGMWLEEVPTESEVLELHLNLLEID